MVRDGHQRIGRAVDEHIRVRHKRREPADQRCGPAQPPAKGDMREIRAEERVRDRVQGCGGKRRRGATQAGEGGG
jgi:hypothetical protein